MSYMSEEDWSSYKDYIEEVHHIHEKPLMFWKDLVSKTFRTNIIELGCGQVKEFRKWSENNLYPSKYQAIDLDVKNDPLTLQANYRNVELYKKICFKPNLLVSLFSTEITANPEENQKLYDFLFSVFPLESALVAGFYYKDKWGLNPIEEPNGLISWQTTFNCGSFDGKNYKEDFRISMPVPSQLFGPNVVEVWRILGKK